MWGKWTICGDVYGILTSVLHSFANISWGFRAECLYGKQAGGRLPNWDDENRMLRSICRVCLLLSLSRPQASSSLSPLYDVAATSVHVIVLADKFGDIRPSKREPGWPWTPATARPIHGVANPRRMRCEPIGRDANFSWSTPPVLS